MTKISPKNIAEAIWRASLGKSGADLGLVARRAAEMLQNKRMLSKGEEILKALQNIIDKNGGVVRAKIISAKSLKGDEKNKLEEEIKKRYRVDKIVSEYFENKELIGGTRIEVGDEVIDTTYKNKLNQLEEFLIREK